MSWLLPGSGRPVADGVLVPLMVFAALATAFVVGASAHSPFGDAERCVARSLPALRLCHLGGLLLCGALLLGVALLTFDLEGVWPAHPLLALLRNLAGLTGLTLITAGTVGARLSWTAPLAFTAIAYLGGQTPDGSGFARWAWTFQSGSDLLSWSIALVMLAAGYALVCLSGAREPAGEE